MSSTASGIKMPIACLPIAAVAVLSGLAAPGDAEANGSRAARGVSLNVVTACSRFGSQCISAPTRPARFGPEIRLPGGTWISCKLDCKSTLRDETLDFWHLRDLDRARRSFRRP